MHCSIHIVYYYISSSILHAVTKYNTPNIIYDNITMIPSVIIANYYH